MRECENYNKMDRGQWRKSEASVKKMLKVKKFDFFSLVLDERSDVWHS